MEHKWIAMLLIAVSAIVFFSARGASQVSAQVAVEPAQPRWQIYSSEYSYSDAVAVNDYRTGNTILLDTLTGETWLLWVNADENYEWTPLQHKKPNIN